MGKYIDITGQTFNKLTVLGRSVKQSNVGAMWDCICECGNLTVVESMKLRKGLTKSCGCHRANLRNMLTHGMANKTRTYKTWKEMRSRCNNPSAHNYKWYGGRGITICNRWDDYANFVADMGERPYGTTIDRINPDGNYEPNNCRWATPKEQAQTNRGLVKPGERRGAKPRIISSETRGRIKQMRADGYSYSRIAKETGVSIGYCHKIQNEAVVGEAAD